RLLPICLQNEKEEALTTSVWIEMVNISKYNCICWLGLHTHSTRDVLFLSHKGGSVSLMWSGPTRVVLKVWSASAPSWSATETMISNDISNIQLRSKRTQSVVA